ncbi:MAG: hypothetical protein P9L99_16665 [Candidatus Lernaella stagnicola]|nr:hypothetical protein [Candidatus Lernaella stagnicola]
MKSDRMRILRWGCFILVIAALLLPLACDDDEEEEEEPSYCEAVEHAFENARECLDEADYWGGIFACNAAFWAEFTVNAIFAPEVLDALYCVFSAMVEDPGSGTDNCDFENLQCDWDWACFGDCNQSAVSCLSACNFGDYDCRKGCYQENYGACMEECF